MAAIRIIDSHLELANIGTNTHAQIDTHIAAADDYVKRDGSLALTADWDIGDTRKIHADEIRARDAAGLKLHDDGGNGIFVKDGGKIGIGTAVPEAKIHINDTSSSNSLVAIGKYSGNNGDIFFYDDNRATNKRMLFGVTVDVATHHRVFFTSVTGESYAKFGFTGYGRMEWGSGNSSADTNLYRDSPHKLRTNDTLIADIGIGICTAVPTALLDVNSDIFRLRTAKTPATAGAAGNQGDICWDADFIYVCTATNSWERAAIAAW